MRWFERRGHASTDASGTVVGIRGVVIDITDRKAADEERAVLFERVTRLQEITAALARAGTPAEVLDTMMGEGLRALLASALVVPLEARERTFGILALGRREPGAFSDADRSLAAGLGTRIAQAVDNALLYRAERRAHEEAKTAAGRLRFLLEVTTALATPLERDDRLELLAQQAAGAICDLCLIDLLEADGSIRRVAAAAGDASLRQDADALRRLLCPHPGDDHPSVAAIRTGRTGLCPEITDAGLRTIATSDAHLEVARRIEPLSYAAVPLVGQGPVLGAICLITTTVSGRRYGPADVLLAEDMATRVAVGLESAAMHEEMRRVAQTLQASLLPSVPPVIPGLEVGTRYVAAEAGAVVGGDFFDVFALGPASWAVVVGDVCGRGVEAATVTGLARHTVRSSALLHRRRHRAPPGRQLLRRAGPRSHDVRRGGADRRRDRGPDRGGGPTLRQRPAGRRHGRGGGQGPASLKRAAAAAGA